MRYRANARVVSPGGKEIGRVTYHVKAKNKSGALSKIRKLFNARPRKRKKNASVAEGAWYRTKGGGMSFHPYRRSADYSLAVEKKAGAKRRTRRARRGRQAVS